MSVEEYDARTAEREKAQSWAKIFDSANRRTRKRKEVRWRSKIREALIEKQFHHRCFCGGGIFYVGVNLPAWRPVFGCTKCARQFSNGDDGGKYADLVPDDEISAAAMELDAG